MNDIISREQLEGQTRVSLIGTANLLGADDGGWGRGQYHRWNEQGLPVGPFCLAGAINRTTFGPRWATQGHVPGAYAFGETAVVATTAKYALVSYYVAHNKIGRLTLDGATFDPYSAQEFDGAVAQINDFLIRDAPEAVAAVLGTTDDFIAMAAGFVHGHISGGTKGTPTLPPFPHKRFVEATIEEDAR